MIDEPSWSTARNSPSLSHSIWRHLLRGRGSWLSRCAQKGGLASQPVTSRVGGAPIPTGERDLDLRLTLPVEDVEDAILPTCRQDAALWLPGEQHRAPGVVPGFQRHKLLLRARKKAWHAGQRARGADAERAAIRPGAGGEAAHHDSQQRAASAEPGSRLTCAVRGSAATRPTARFGSASGEGTSADRLTSKGHALKTSVVREITLRGINGRHASSALGWSHTASLISWRFV